MNIFSRNSISIVLKSFIIYVGQNMDVLESGHYIFCDLPLFSPVEHHYAIGLKVLVDSHCAELNIFRRYNSVALSTQIIFGLPTPIVGNPDWKVFYAVVFVQT